MSDVRISRELAERVAVSLRQYARDAHSRNDTDHVVILLDVAALRAAIAAADTNSE